MEEKLHTIHRLSGLNNLRVYVQSLCIEKLCSELRNICPKENGSTTVQILFRGLSNSPVCHEKRAKIILEVLDNIQKKIVCSRLAKRLVSILITEVEYLTSSHLVSFINKCLVATQQEEGNEYSWWEDLLPQLLIVVNGRTEVEQNGIKITGEEFKKQVVTSLLMNEWKCSMMPNYAAMFVDIPLSSEEHSQVVNKLCKSIGNMKMNEIPPLVHQLLQLTKEQNSFILFVTLANYFDENLYSHIRQGENSNEKSLKEVQTIEGTVLYHIHTAATIFNPKSIKDLLKNLKDSLNNPNFVLRPFFITVLLKISGISSSFEEEALSVITSALIRAVAEEEKVLKSSWLTSIVPIRIDLELVFDKVLQNCFRDRDGILKELVSLCFSLLALKFRGKDAHTHFGWTMAINLLINLVQQHPHITNDVFRNLMNQISQEQDSTQYTDCLCEIARKRPLNLLESSSMILQLLSNVCARLTPAVAQRILIAILPLTKLSPTLRDNLIIFFRKALFGDQSCRETAVFGFLELLKDMKIADMRSLSQSTSQNYVGITQIYSGTYDRGSGAISNEGICLEILTILSQVFGQHHRIKIMLYKGVYHTFRVNPKLGVHILDLLKSRLDTFRQSDSEKPPLDFNKVVARQGSSLVVKEPLGHLLLGMGLITAKMADDCGVGAKFRQILNSLCEGMSASDIPHFELGKVVRYCDNSDFDGDNSLERELDKEKIVQILGVYEALMGYTLCSWTSESLESARMLNALFKGYSKLSDYAKGSAKMTKKKQEDKKTSEKSKDNNQGKWKSKLQVTSSETSVTILNLKCASRLLIVLTGAKVEWATEKSTEVLRSKRDLHRYAYNVVFQLLNECKALSPGELVRTGTGSRTALQYLFYIGRLLYEHCVVRLSELKEFDMICAVSAMECFFEFLSFVQTHFKKKFAQFLMEMGVPGKEFGTQLKNLLELIIDRISDLLSESEEDEETKEELHSRKLCSLLLSICLVFIDHLPSNGSHGQEVYERIRKTCMEKAVGNANIAKTFVSLLLSMAARVSSNESVILNLVLSLCNVMTLIDDEMEIEVHETYKIVNVKTANACLTSICDDVRVSVNQVEWALARCKAEVAMLQYSSAESLDTLMEKERGICRRLNFNIKILSMLCAIAVPPGSLADSLLKEVGNLYSKLVSTTKYFIWKFTKHRDTFGRSKFPKTIKMADNELTKNMYCFTEHIIADGAASVHDPSLKKNKADATALKNKVLKETKIIPKVIFEKEQFQKFVLQLSNKTKIELEMKNSMARDYRLYARQLKEILEREKDISECSGMETEELEDDSTDRPPKKLRTQE